MDEFVQNTLAEWGLERYTDSFSENEIDKDTFMLLEHTFIAEIIKPVGPRMKFLNHLKDLQGSLNSKHISEQGDDKDQLPAETLPPPAKKSKQQMVREHGTTQGPLLAHTVPPAAQSSKKKMDIQWILSQRGDSKQALAELEDGFLSYRSRKIVVNTLVSYLIENYGKHVKSDVKLAMAKALVEQYPKLDNEEGDGYAAWYTPGKGYHDAGGYLETRLRNVRYRDPVKDSSNKPSKVHHREESSTASTDLDLSLSDLQEDDMDMKAKLNWLRCHTHPKDQVASWMKETCKSRAVYIRREKEVPTADLLRQFPRLMDTDGMVEQDFEILFPQAANELFLKWPRIFKDVLRYAEKQVDWRNYLNYHGEMETEEQESNIAVHVLPLLFPPGCTKKPGQKSQRATIDEACKHFIDQKEIGTNIPEYLETKCQKQPSILILGEVNRPEQAFAIVEKCAIPCKNLLHAVDICFKLIYVLDVDYPWQCGNTWDFVQKFIFGLGDGKGRAKSVPSVSLLATFLQNQVNH